MDLAHASRLAHDLLAEHGLADWTFAYDRSRRRFGVCHYSDRRIGLSRELTRLNDAETVRDVLLHEVAHALAGHRAGHGHRWRTVAVSIGADPSRTYDENVVVAPVPRYVGSCPACGASVRRHRRDRLACRRCCELHGRRRFDARFLLVWEDAREQLAG